MNAPSGRVLMPPTSRLVSFSMLENTHVSALSTPSGSVRDVSSAYEKAHAPMSRSDEGSVRVDSFAP